MNPADREAGHCGGKNCFQGRPKIDCCMCDCEACTEAVAAEMVEQAREEVRRSADARRKSVPHAGEEGDDHEG